MWPIAFYNNVFCANMPTPNALTPQSYEKKLKQAISPPIPAPGAYPTPSFFPVKEWTRSTAQSGDVAVSHSILNNFSRAFISLFVCCICLKK